MSELNASNLRKEHGNEGPDLVGTTELTSPYYMVPPSGTTAQRPQNPEPGTLRFNTDIGSLEFYRGDTIGWESVNKVSSDLNGGARAVYGGGFTSPANSNIIDYGSIATGGIFVQFGTLTRTDRLCYSGVSSRTRGCWGGGFPQATQSTIDYITISSTGVALGFGNMTAGRIGATGVSNQTRGCWAGGYSYAPGPRTVRDVVDYITIASTGNSSDFGTNNSEVGLTYSGAGFASPTRGIFASGKDKPAANAYNKDIRYITIQSKGTGAHFGELTFSGSYTTGCSNSTRGLVMGGSTPTKRNEIEYITIATFGNTTDFGDMTTATSALTSAASSTRGLNVGGQQSPALTNTIEYVTIASTGNATNFGDLTVARSTLAGCSDVHGGLGD